MAGGRSSCYIILVNALLICLQGGKLNGNNSVLLNLVCICIRLFIVYRYPAYNANVTLQLHVISELNPKQISGEKQEMGNLQIFVEKQQLIARYSLRPKIYSAPP